ncbi:hypothetical protein FTO74_14375 [Granulicella sp. WH15]|uniref:phage head morphogenesis protein n=1 Tax=Granulicella sp. WH15 TaxID=2602070 RepID=UPI0013669469|nr:phage minor head protein [Granulicella sp. WH15]QHN04418.1 hypothetical protein FTO74_14375 [Granulicella sp. WH15]
MARPQLVDILATHLAAANVLGRVDVLTAAKRRTGKSLPLATSSRLNFAEAGADSLNLGFGFDLPNDDAAQYIRSLTPVTKETFDGLTAQYRRLAFTLAGNADLRLIKNVRDELADVVQHGGNSDDFAAVVNKMTSDEGVERINAFSLDNAFEIATHRAYGQGRYEQQTDPAMVDALPFWTFLTMRDDAVRPAHAALEGFTARATDPVWNRIYPPCDFGCRCTTIAKLPSEVSDDASEDGTTRLGVLRMAAAAPVSFGGLF